MSDPRWALLRPDEDGNPLKWLGGERELRELLAHPDAWNVSEFVHIDDMGQKDPAYWRDGQVMLLRVEVVVPVRGGWRLPEDAPPEPFEPNRLQMRYVNSGDGPLTLGEVLG